LAAARCRLSVDCGFAALSLRRYRRFRPSDFVVDHAHRLRTLDLALLQRAKRRQQTTENARSATN
jgi:hypothetical protein